MGPNVRGRSSEGDRSKEKKPNQRKHYDRCQLIPVAADLAPLPIPVLCTCTHTYLYMHVCMCMWKSDISIRFLMKLQQAPSVTREARGFFVGS